MSERVYDLKVLLVEDESIIRESFRSLLKRRVKKFISAQNGIEGLEKYKQSKSDIVFTDIKMPKMDGLEMVNEIRKIEPNARIFVISAHSEPEYLLDAIEAGVNGFLIKPVEKSKLYDMLERINKELKLKKVVEEKRREKELAELKLRQKEKKYRKIFEQLQDVFFETDLAGNIITITPSVKDFTGYSIEEISNKNVKILYANSEERDKFIEKIMQDSSVKNFETLLTKKDGSKISVAINAQLIYDRNGNMQYIGGVLHDITFLKKIEKALSHRLKLETLYSEVSELLIKKQDYKKSIQEALNIIGSKMNVSRVFVFEDSNNKKHTSNTFEWTNKNVEPQKDNLQHIPYSIIPSFRKMLKKDGLIVCASIKDLPKDIYEFLDSQKIYSILVVPLLIKDEISGFIGFCERAQERYWQKEEITLLKNIANIIANYLEKTYADQELKNSEEKFRVISSSANDAVVMADEKGMVTFWNKAAEEIFGYKSEEIMGKDLHGKIAPKRYKEEYEKGWEKFRHTGEGQAVGKTTELYALRRNGEEFPVELSLASVKLQDRWNAIGIIRDITKRKENEKKIKEQNESLLNELEIAASVQQYLLPNWLVYEKEIIFSSAYTPSSQVGGDIFDIKQIGERKYVLYVGDISGHGVQAALLMTAVRSTISMLINSERKEIKPYKIINKLNRIISKELFHQNYLTMIFTIIDLEKNKISYLNAGHPPILKYNMQTQKTEILPTKGGIPIGWDKDYNYKKEEQDSIEISETNLYFLYTDGIFECQDKKRNQLGLPGFRKFLDNNIENPNDFIIPHKIKHKLIGEDYDVSYDDFTLVCLRKLLPQDNEKKSYLIRSLVENIDSVAINCESFIKNKFKDSEFAAKVEIVVDEFLNMVIKKGYVNKAESLIMLQLESKDILKLTFWDKGEDWQIPQIQPDSEEMGFQLIHSIASKIVRKRFGEINETVIEIPYGRKD
ncbi:MAG: PAS domain S-box protein [Candidatus Cloacimonadota bacterium]|nr:PAS domain S-box protein [Candidatus Cloacimonadota bacterium]